MPDSVLPPPSQANEAGSQPPRMSTPQPSNNASSQAAAWAGWAISSFTNQLSTAAGQIQAGSSNGTPATTPQRTVSPSAAGPSAPPSMSSASALHRQAVNSPQPPASMSRSSSATAAAFLQGGDAGPEDAGDEDFGDAWGDMGDMDDDDDTANNNSGADAWNAASSSPPPTTSPAASSWNGQGAAAKASPAPFDDDSEPDFAGWLAAQAQKKNPTSKPLPKGLAKSSSGKKPLSSSGGAPAKRPTPAPKKKIDMKPKETADDDGWGDGW